MAKYRTFPFPNPLPASPKSDELNIKCGSQIFMVVFGGGAAKCPKGEGGGGKGVSLWLFMICHSFSVSSDGLSDVPKKGFIMVLPISKDAE